MIEPLFIMRAMSWLLSLAMGSFGVFCLLMSFAAPLAGLYAILMLGTASALTLAAAR